MATNYHPITSKYKYVNVSFSDHLFEILKVTDEWVVSLINAEKGGSLSTSTWKKT